MGRKIIPYNPKLVPLGRKLRNNSTISEILFWNKVKGKQLGGYDFHRQKPIGNYIVDFYCPELLLVIEIDGSTHRWKTKEDLVRHKRLEAFGLQVIHFTDRQVKQEMESVLDQLIWVIKERKKELNQK